MGISRHYLKENNFILSRLSGEINDRNLKDHILELNKETNGISNLRDLADCRGIENLQNLTVSGTTHDAQVVENRPDCVTAILVNDSHLLYGMARVFQMFLEEKRKSVEIFKDLHKALSWLAINDQEIEIFKKFVENA